VGSFKVSYVSELAKLLRRKQLLKPIEQRKFIHELRLRNFDSDTFNQFQRVNVAGVLTADTEGSNGSIWLWNLASEGTTIVDDAKWVHLIETLKPARIFVFRGGLESIIKPLPLRDGRWPFWIPRGWRGYASMEPRCYFSSTWWRRMKDMAIDRLKQKVRLKLLAKSIDYSLLTGEEIWKISNSLFSDLAHLSNKLLILGMLPIDGSRFPGSAEQFGKTNQILKTTAEVNGGDFFDWGAEMKACENCDDLFFRDGFHPNHSGAEKLAQILIKTVEDLNECN